MLSKRRLVIAVALLTAVGCQRNAGIPSDALTTWTVEELRSTCSAETRLYDTGTFFDDPEGAMKAELATSPELGATTMAEVSRSGDEAEYGLIDESYVVALVTVVRSDGSWAVGRLTRC